MKKYNAATLALSAALTGAALIPTLLVLRAKPAAAHASAAAPDDKYLEAQSDIRKAREALRDFLAASPTGLHGYIAKRQLQALGTLSPSNTESVPTPMERSDITWRVVTVECSESDTKVTLEYANNNPTKNKEFTSFDYDPLVIVANHHLYTMKKHAYNLTPSITSYRNQYGNPALSIQAGVTGKIDVTFEPFDGAVTSGTVRYANGGEGPEFSMMNIKQIKPL